MAFLFKAYFKNVVHIKKKYVVDCTIADPLLQTPAIHIWIIYYCFGLQVGFEHTHVHKRILIAYNVSSMVFDAILTTHKSTYPLLTMLPFSWNFLCGCSFWKHQVLKVSFDQQSSVGTVPLFNTEDHFHSLFIKRHCYSFYLEHQCIKVCNRNQPS